MINPNNPKKKHRMANRKIIIFFQEDRKKNFPIVFTQFENENGFKEICNEHVGENPLRIELSCGVRELYVRLGKLNDKRGLSGPGFSVRFSICEEELQKILQ